MSFIVKADYHFHPNLSRSKKHNDDKIESIYAKLIENKINTLIVTEHSYRNPKKAYLEMKKQKPDNFFLFPGVECVTKEGIDFIVFSKDESIYKYKELKPFALNIDELINFINSKQEFEGFLPHPFTLGNTSLFKYYKEDKYFDVVNKTHSVEISNNSFANIRKILANSKIPRITDIVQRIDRNLDLPIEYYPNNIKFLASGSDAHHVEEIGPHYELISDLSNPTYEEVFSLITNNKGKGKSIKNPVNFNSGLLIKSATTTFYEAVIKNLTKRRNGRNNN